MSRAKRLVDAHRYGPAAVVAGAAEGLGAAFAAELARAGLELVLIDVRAPELEALARRLEASHGARVHAVVVDLASPDVGDAVARAVGGLDVGLLVYNAAAAPVGAFTSMQFGDAMRAIDVNNRGALALVAAVLPMMITRARGGVLLVGSNAGLIGHPLTAVYGASKAFLVRLGEALHGELGPLGVDVLVACPGAVATPGFFRSGARLPRGAAASPADVAREALEQLGGPGPVVVLGRANRAAMRLLSMLPRQLAVRVLGRVMSATYRVRAGVEDR
ncbi:MAG: SDR family NAD(P)-dependent oxidoreductase [Polyangiaceae bacterium]|nr:SDR family NAD(P)-dependent oxidoreductase [Polyangiaceae bacterium]MBK8936702.1 SDR family NAD(P)-dependent oxidoreductase [Polyangiaceae bacterium]